MALSAANAITSLLEDEPQQVREVVVAFVTRCEEHLPKKDITASVYIEAEKLVQSRRLRATMWLFIADNYAIDFITPIVHAAQAGNHDDTPISLYDAACTTLDPGQKQTLKSIAFETLLTRQAHSVSEIPKAWFHADTALESRRAATQASLFEQLLTDSDFLVPDINPIDIVPALLLIIGRIITSKTKATAKCTALYYNAAFLQKLGSPFVDSDDRHACAYLSRMLDTFEDPGRRKWMFSKCPQILSNIARENLIATITSMTLRQPPLPLLFDIAGITLRIRRHEFTPQMTKILIRWLGIKSPTEKHRRLLAEEAETVHTDCEEEDELVMKDVFDIDEDEESDETASDNSDDEPY